VQQVREEAQLRAAIQGFLDSAPDHFAGQSPRQVRGAVQSFVEGQPALAWARRPAAQPALWFRVREALHMIGVPALLVLLLPLVIVGLLIWVGLLRLHELTDPAPDVPLDAERLRMLRDLEDVVVQNPISTIAPIKASWFWQRTATLFFALADYSSRHVFNRGSLAGLRTVHFARFMKLDHGRRVLFTSYYDGSLESYMNDFIDQVSWVLNGMFGNQAGYPKTRWLAFDGAMNEHGFKGFLRGHQIPTQVWYSAYAQLSAVNVDNNAQIRAGLFGEMSDAEAAEWLRRL
jgi:hypothetical protein